MASADVNPRSTELPAEFATDGQTVVPARPTVTAVRRSDAAPAASWLELCPAGVTSGSRWIVLPTDIAG